MAKLVNREGIQHLEPLSYFGDVKICSDQKIIVEIIGISLYWELNMQAAEALFPDFPELAMIIPVLSFNTLQRAKLSFYQSLTVGKLDETDIPLNWSKKLPDDDGMMYQKCAKLMKWG